MKKLIYQIAGYTGIYNPQTDAVEQKLSLAKVIVENPTEKDFAKATEIAYDGEYTIEDDGQPEPVVEPTAEERIAELEEALALLLSGVTE